MQGLFSIGFMAIYASSLVVADQSQKNIAIEIDDLLQETTQFFEEWQSVQLTRMGVKIHLDPETKVWVESGRMNDSLAWDGSRTHFFHRSIWRPWNLPDRRYADGRELLAIDGNRLELSFKFPTPTVDELASPDFSRLDVSKSQVLNNLYCDWTEEPAAIDENNKRHPGRIELLTGRFLNPAWGDGNILTYFTGRKDIDLQSVVMLDRQCWRISIPSVKGTGAYSLTVCPELNFAPVEFEVVRGKNDRFPDGSPVRIATENGSHRKAFRTLRRMEEANIGMTDFTMRVQDWSENEDGTSMGFGGIYHFSDVVRPAPEDAFRLQVPIKDGTRVFLTSDSQIRAEWRDGKVVRVYDGEAVKELASVEMVPATTSPWKKAVTVALVLAAVGWGWRKWKPTNSSQAGGK